MNGRIIWTTALTTFMGKCVICSEILNKLQLLSGKILWSRWIPVRLPFYQVFKIRFCGQRVHCTGTDPSIKLILSGQLPDVKQKIADLFRHFHESQTWEKRKCFDPNWAQLPWKLLTIRWRGAIKKPKSHKHSTRQETFSLNFLVCYQSKIHDKNIKLNIT